MDDFDEFEKAVESIRKVAMPILEEFFGTKCEEFDPDCEVCKRWKAFEALIDNPFRD